MLAGASAEEKRRWHLDSVRARELRYLRPNAGDTLASTLPAATTTGGGGRYLRWDGAPDGDAWPELRAVMRALPVPLLSSSAGSSSAAAETGEAPYDVAEAVFRCAAGVLHLGQIAFEEPTDVTAAASVTASGGIGVGSSPQCVVTASSAGDLHLAAALLGVHEADLADALLRVPAPAFLATATAGSKGRAASSSSSSSAAATLSAWRSKAAAVDARDELARGTYRRLFAFVVEAANQGLEAAIATATASAGHGAKAGNGDAGGGSSVAVLDVFGFERLEINSLEQLMVK